MFKKTSIATHHEDIEKYGFKKITSYLDKTVKMVKPNFDWVVTIEDNEERSGYSFLINIHKPPLYSENFTFAKYFDSTNPVTMVDIIDYEELKIWMNQTIFDIPEVCHPHEYFKKGHRKEFWVKHKQFDAKGGLMIKSANNGTKIISEKECEVMINGEDGGDAKIINVSSYNLIPITIKFPPPIRLGSTIHADIPGVIDEESIVGCEEGSCVVSLSCGVTQEESDMMRHEFLRGEFDSHKNEASATGWYFFNHCPDCGAKINKEFIIERLKKFNK